jgi:glucosamine-6-phosphate deaminase
MVSNRLNWSVFDDSRALARAAADFLTEVVSPNSSPDLLVATGKTPLALYEHMGEQARRGETLWKNSTVWALDEYVGVAGDDPSSFQARLWQTVGEPLGLPRNKVVAPDGLALDPHAEASRYETALSLAGYADLAILGVGANGHIAFNEPGTAFTSKTHVSELASATRMANAGDFGGNPESVPSHAITVGISTILRSRTILLLAQGSAKAPAVESLRRGVGDPEWPVTALLDHERVHVMLDRQAAGQ